MCENSSQVTWGKLKGNIKMGYKGRGEYKTKEAKEEEE